jgi:cellobiose phosphorylase
LTAFFNVGEHNNIKLEDADWNDGMDMAPDKHCAICIAGASS